MATTTTVQLKNTVDNLDQQEGSKPQFEGREIILQVGRPTKFTEQVSHLFGNAVSWTNFFFNVGMYLTVWKLIFVGSDKVYADFSSLASKGYNGMVDGVVKIIEAAKK